MCRRNSRKRQTGVCFFAVYTLFSIAFFVDLWYTVKDSGKGGASVPSDILRQEIRGIAKRAAFLDIAAYLISVIVCGATVSFAVGLLLGTAVLLGTLLLLKISVERMAADAKRSGVTSQRRYLLYYAMRLGVFAAAFGTAVILRSYISPVAVAVPMLYPRLIYTAGALFQRAGSSAGQKRGE